MAAGRNELFREMSAALTRIPAFLCLEHPGWIHLSLSSFISVSETHKIGEMDDHSWLLGNINQTGYFRVNYDLQNWKLLIHQLHDNHQVCQRCSWGFLISMLRLAWRSPSPCRSDHLRRKQSRPHRRRLQPGQVSGPARRPLWTQMEQLILTQ